MTINNELLIDETERVTCNSNNSIIIHLLMTWSSHTGIHISVYRISYNNHIVDYHITFNIVQMLLIQQYKHKNQITGG